MTARSGSTTLAAALTSLVLAALSVAGAGTATAADPLYGAPAAGQCYDMGADEIAAASYTEAAVDCAGPHTALTLAVVALPDDIGYDSVRKLERFTLETCVPAQRKAIRSSLLGLRLTAYNLAFFGPTPEQQAAGAHWLRCDMVLGAFTAPEQLPGSLKVGAYPFKKSVSRCLAGRDVHLTTCDERHTFRATAAMKVKGSRYPTKRAWQRIGTSRCRTAVTSRTYRWGGPSKIAWKAGDHTLICYSKTRR